MMISYKEWKVFILKGIDVSNHNGNINWSLVKSNGIECAYIKASEGTTYQDPYMNNNYNGAKLVGLPTGFYHFLVGSSKPESQAENFYNCIKNKESNLLPCLDLEHSNNEPSDFMDYALRFIERFKALSGMNICIYACPSFIAENLDSRLAKYPLWCAHYGVDRPGFTKVWGSSYVGHQYTETGRVAGITGNVDMNNFTDGILIDGQAWIQNNNESIDNEYAALQSELNTQGFTDKNGNPLKIDGVPGELTLSACPTVRIGASGNITKWIQRHLINLNYKLDVDGDFGPITQEAVRQFQKANNLETDGVVGPKTWSYLLGIN